MKNFNLNFVTNHKTIYLNVFLVSEKRVIVLHMLFAQVASGDEREPFFHDIKDIQRKKQKNIGIM